MHYLKMLTQLYRLKQNEKKTPEQIKKLQQQKLRMILRYAYEHSVYYQKTFAEAGITAENIDEMPLSAFPSIDKQQLLTNFDELVTVADLKQDELRRFDAEETARRKPFKGKYHIVHSSGSTGKPGYFVYDEAAWQSMLSGIVRGALWGMSMPQIVKLLLKGPRIVYIAATDGRYGGAMAVGDGIDGMGAKRIYLDIQSPLNEWIDRIKAFRPNMIIGYPSAIKILGELVDKGEIKLGISRIISCGEPLGASLRRYLENTFQAKVINFYGASESLSMGAESDSAEGMILFDDMNVIEIQDGSLYLTCLYNFAQPLIRYRLSDNLAVHAPEKDSRYPFTRAVGLIGRNEDILWFKNSDGRKEFLHPLAVEGICIEGLKDYQFRQISADTFEMLAEVCDPCAGQRIRTEILEQMKKILAEKRLSFVRFSVTFVEEISPEKATGKKRLIVKNAEKREGAA